MAWAKILTLLDGADSDASVTATGLAIGKAFSASVDGLIVRPDPRDAVRLAIDGMSPAMIESVIDAARDESGRRIARARDSFETACADADGSIAASWHEKVGLSADEVANFGRLSDLVVVGHPTRRGSDDSDIAVESVLFETSRPLLLAAEEPLDLDSLNIVLAWNGGRESAFAATAALPLLKRAKSVTVLEVNGEGLRGPTGKELCEYLRCHGVTATAALETDTNRSVAETILVYAKEQGANLLVMGAYGHSRLRELVLGGVTRQILIDAELAVLMVH
jgi:nucleotide-binding universal stress UspA family protein